MDLEFHLLRREVPAAQQYSERALVAVGVSGVVESVVNQLVPKGAATMVATACWVIHAFAFKFSDQHGRRFENGRQSHKRSYRQIIMRMRSSTLPGAGLSFPPDRPFSGLHQ